MTRKKCLAFFVTVLIEAGAFCSFSHATENGPIGQISEIQQRENNPIEVFSNGKEKRAACLHCEIFENDVILTKTKQTLTLIMNEGTELAIGSNSRVTLDNWNRKESSGYIKRAIFLTVGFLRATVKKLYSAEQPFYVKTRDSIMGVRGTQFAVQVENERTGKFSQESTVHLFTLEGEVHFARTENELLQNKFIRTLPGDSSAYQTGMSRPTTPRKFEINTLKQLMIKRLPQIDKIQLQDHTYSVKEEDVRDVVSPLNQKSDKPSSHKEESPQSSEYPQRTTHPSNSEGRSDIKEDRFSELNAETDRRKMHQHLPGGMDLGDENARREQKRLDQINNQRRVQFEQNSPGQAPGRGPMPDGANAFQRGSTTGPGQIQGGPPPQGGPPRR